LGLSHEPPSEANKQRLGAGGCSSEGSVQA
jgi:hypothetical protein